MKSRGNKIFSVLALTFLLSSCLPQSEEQKTYNDLTTYNLTGKVKKVIERSYVGIDMKFSRVQKGDLIQTFTHTFNKRGLEIEKTMTNPNSTDLFITSYKFDKQGNLIEEIETTPKESIPLSRIIREYDKKGKLVTLLFYNAAGDIVSKESYTYDNTGNLISVDKYKADGTLSEKKLFAFENGEKIEQVYLGDGSLISKTIHKYDQHGREIEQCSYGKEGGLYFKSNAQFRENGILSEISKSWMDMLYTYLNSMEVKRFDNDGNIIEDSKYTPDGKVVYKIIVNYPSYDNNRNWLVKERIMEIRGERTLGDTWHLVERQIEYF